jgi:GDPmannose 4,6-dehydratase
MTKKVAAITGITGQDGSYLAELLLSKGYEVHGLRRRSSTLNTGRIDHLYKDPFESKTEFYLHYGDMSDSLSLINFLTAVKPDEIYNLAAQSHVGVSFENPEYTANAGALGCLRLLEAVRLSRLSRTTKFYQASTSEMYGGLQAEALSEISPFSPRSPYAVAKLYAYWTTINYRSAYGLHASNGILFNHESPRRGETFLTRKVTKGLARIAFGRLNHLTLGNLDAERDWGHAKDYVEAMWLMLQQEEPSDYVIATGKSCSVRDFVTMAAKEYAIELTWHGTGTEEKAFNKNGDIVITVDPTYFRPLEVDFLLGDPSKAKSQLLWEPKYSLEDLVQEMCRYDFDLEKTKDN